MEPHTAEALVDYLNSMRFMLRVDVEDLSGVLVVQTLAGPLPADGGVVSRTDSLLRARHPSRARVSWRQ